MSRKLDVVTLTGEEYDDLMECKEVVTSLLAQLSAAKDRIAELTPVAGTDWRETMQRMRYWGLTDFQGLTPKYGVFVRGFWEELDSQSHGVGATIIHDVSG